MKLSGTAATTNPMTDGRDFRFTTEDLERMAVQAPGTPVFLDFNKTVSPVGVVVAAEVTPDGLSVTVEILPALFGERDLYCVPAVTLKNEKPRDVKLTEFGITRTPADTTLKPLTRG